jgi:CheY-like chemotaxis protein
MPAMNGYEVARRARADPATATTVLIAVTGWGQAADKQAAADAGFDHHLVKPLAPDDLLDVLAALPAAPTRLARDAGPLVKEPE